MTKYFIGLDIGQAQDYTALCVIEVPSIPRTYSTGPYFIREHTQSANPIIPPVKYRVRHLQRFPLRTPYPKIVIEVGKIVKRLDKATLVIDQTGVGRAIYDMFQQEGLRPVGITIHGGDRVADDGNSFRVPKRDLVGILTLAFQNGELKIANSLTESRTLVNELLNFKVTINMRTAHDSYEVWREGVHDDLVLALAIAVWYTDLVKPWRQSAIPRMRRKESDIPLFDAISNELPKM